MARKAAIVRVALGQSAHSLLSDIRGYSRRRIATSHA